MVEISHVSEFIEYVVEKRPRYIRNQHFLYRGESSLDYKLLPSVYRIDKETGKETGKETYLSKSTEFKILKDFITDGASYIDLSPDDMFRWLQYAQHFSAPTRLLDWTSNPLVALYFSCSGNNKKDKCKDGRVYVLNSVGYKILSAKINDMDDKIILDETMKMIKGIENTFPYPIIFKPYYFDERMFSQSSRFMIWGYRKDPFNKLVSELESGVKPKEYINERSKSGIDVPVLQDLEILSEIRIRGDDKLSILRELDELGVNEGTLFPGLDGIGRAVKWRNDIKNMV